MRALVPVGAAKMTRDPISRVDVLDGQPLAGEETDVAVEIPPAGHIQLGPEVIALCGGVIGNDVLASGKGQLEARSRVAKIKKVFMPEGIYRTSTTIKNRLPTMYADREFVEAGGLMSYGPDYIFMYRRVAVFLDKILNGTKPADLPVEQPTKFEFIVN